MATTNNNKRVLHRKEWQMMTPSPVASSAWSFIIKDPVWSKRTSLFVSSATVQYLYWVDEDAWMLTPSMSLAGTFGAGACWAWWQWSNTITANGWSTTTFTTTATINAGILGNTVRFLTWSQAWKEATITSMLVVPGWTTTVTFSPALSGAIVNTDTLAIQTWRYYVMNAGTVASGIFKSIDPITGTVTTLWTTNLPASWGTDWRLVSTPSYVWKYVTDTTPDIFSSTTIGLTTKAWTVNSWTNFQVRIISGTGIWQIRTISSNTATTLTVPTWTTTPDGTSVFAIEANDDFLYLIGNNAVTMYRYSISGNTWTVMAPTVARSAAMVAWWWANWISKTWYSTWSNETNIQDWRYIFSFRWGASTALDRFDIAGWTAGAGAWSTITYVWAAETFTTWSSYDVSWSQMFIRKDATNRFFYYSVIWNMLYPFNTLQYPDSTAVLWDKLFTARYTDWATSIDWLYALRNSSTELHRIMIF